MDIDIDTPTNFDPTKIFSTAVPASMVKGDQLVKHPCGHYLQNIAIDKYTGLAAIPYKEAEEFGYLKIDFLHLHVLDFFQDKNEIRTLLKLEPNWNLLLDENNVQKLFQISKHYSLIAKIRPRSVQDLADCLALQRPSKKHLLDAYLKDRNLVRETLLYTKEADGYMFKRSHSIAYALTIVLQLHLIELGVL